MYCQLLDAVHPGSVPMNKVNWKAKYDYEFISNYKLLQESLECMGVGIKLDVQKLIKCKYQDNFEMIQEFRRILDKYGSPDFYDPVARRTGGLQDTTSKPKPAGDKENRKKSISTINCLTTKNSTSKKFEFPVSTPTNKKLSLMNRSVALERVQCVPDMGRSDEEKLKLIREILCSKEEEWGQLERIRRVVFESDVEEEDEIL